MIFLLLWKLDIDKRIFEWIKIILHLRFLKNLVSKQKQKNCDDESDSSTTQENHWIFYRRFIPLSNRLILWVKPTWVYSSNLENKIDDWSTFSNKFVQSDCFLFETDYYLVITISFDSNRPRIVSMICFYCRIHTEITNIMNIPHWSITNVTGITSSTLVRFISARNDKARSFSIIRYFLIFFIIRSDS